MKKYKNGLDIVLVLLLAIISLFTIAPKQLVMPTSLQMALFVIAFGFVSAFVVLVWREDPADEREAEHQHEASRAAYLAGCSLLIVAMVVQGFRHHLDPVIPLALFLMIVTKLGIQRYKDKK